MGNPKRPKNLMQRMQLETCKANPFRPITRPKSGFRKWLTRVFMGNFYNPNHKFHSKIAAADGGSLLKGADNYDGFGCVDNTCDTWRKDLIKFVDMVYKHYAPGADVDHTPFAPGYPPYNPYGLS